MCPTGTMNCGGACTTTSTDVRHCGDCATQCDVDEVCVDGNCRGYAVATGCTACPCTVCAALDGACCQPMASGVTPICVDGGGACPAGFSRP
jgi:hypothetical protein